MVDFKDLKVWQKAHHMTLETYRATAAFPKEEIYGLTSQLSASGGLHRCEHCGGMR